MFLCLLHNGLVGIFPPNFAAQAIGTHNAPDLFMVHDDFMVVFQVHLHLPPAYLLFALVKDILNQQKVSVILGLFVFLVKPLVVTGPGYSAQMTGSGNTGC